MTETPVDITEKENQAPAGDEKTRPKNEPPLPWEFYNYRGWFDSLMKFYADDKKLLPREILDAPIKALIVAIRDVIDVYGNFPSDTAKALGYTINPLYEPGEYIRKVYEPLRKESLEKGDSNLMFMADGLLTIRAFFEKEERFVNVRFEKEIEQISNKDFSDNAEIFAEHMRNIAKTHVTQIVKLIKDFAKKSAPQTA